MQSYILFRCMNNTSMILGELYKTNSTKLLQTWIDQVKEFGNESIAIDMLNKFDPSNTSTMVHNCLMREMKTIVSYDSWVKFMNKMSTYYKRNNINFSGELIEFEHKRIKGKL